MAKRELGVVIARFQAPTLTTAHQYLLEQVATRADRVLVLLGVSPVPLLKRHPLEYTLRAQMLQSWWTARYQQELIILPLPDCPTDASWKARVEQAIDLININGRATVYCGPDGAGPAYQSAGGRWKVEVLDSMGGHASRERFGIEPRYTEDFRAGVIYAIERQFNMPRMVVDMIIDSGAGEVLLGQKGTDEGHWRFIGGFVDATDGSLERAVKREVMEETGLEVDDPKYLGSCRIDDWRYRGGPEIILSSVFRMRRLFGHAKAADDIEVLRWFPEADVEKLLHPIHKPLWAMRNV